MHDDLHVQWIVAERMRRLSRQAGALSEIVNFGAEPPDFYIDIDNIALFITEIGIILQKLHYVTELFPVVVLRCRKGPRYPIPRRLGGCPKRRDRAWHHGARR